MFLLEDVLFSLLTNTLVLVQTYCCLDEVGVFLERTLTKVTHTIIGQDMGDGRETKRSRVKGHKDWVIIKLSERVICSDGVILTMTA